VGGLRDPHRVNSRFVRCRFRFSSARRGPAPDCSPVSFETGSVWSTARTDHGLLQPDILAVPSYHRRFHLVARVTSRLTTSHSDLRPNLCPCGDTPMRLTTSHGRAQSCMFGIRQSPEPHNGHLHSQPGLRTFPERVCRASHTKTNPRLSFALNRETSLSLGSSRSSSVIVMWFS
jgi:hypothetical protein